MEKRFEDNNLVLCPHCGKLITTNEDIETHECTGVCYECYIRISEEDLVRCTEGYYFD